MGHGALCPPGRVPLPAAQSASPAHAAAVGAGVADAGADGWSGPEADVAGGGSILLLT